MGWRPQLSRAFPGLRPGLLLASPYGLKDLRGCLGHRVESQANLLFRCPTNATRHS